MLCLKSNLSEHPIFMFFTLNNFIKIEKQILILYLQVKSLILQILKKSKMKQRQLPPPGISTVGVDVASVTACVKVDAVLSVVVVPPSSVVAMLPVVVVPPSSVVAMLSVVEVPPSSVVAIPCVVVIPPSSVMAMLSVVVPPSSVVAMLSVVVVPPSSVVAIPSVEVVPPSSVFEILSKVVVPPATVVSTVPGAVISVELVLVVKATDVGMLVMVTPAGAEVVGRVDDPEEKVVVFSRKEYKQS